MKKQMTMPQLGESVTEGTISKWLVAPGDKVKKYDPIAEVMTDKVNAEVPSSYEGTIGELLVKEDETVAVGTAICTIAVEGEPEQTIEQIEETQVDIAEVEADTSMKRRYSPAVLRLANEHNIDLELVQGTGKGGRITRKDLYALIESGTQLSKVETNQVAPMIEQVEPPTKAPSIQTAVGDIEIPVTGVRKAIAQNMVRSKRETPHAWLMVEVDVTNLVKYREKMKEQFKQREGFNLTFLPFFVKVVVESLKEFPQLNSMWAGDKIIQKKDIHMSIAVATEDALYVPVIKHADEKNIKGLARELHELATKVRTNKLTSDEMQGGTFTINNTGTFGSVLSTPIINYPQAAILSVESIVKRPVVMEGDMIAIRSMVNLCLSLDHRILDGLVCGRFLARVKEKLESMTEENTSIY
ncbi:MAG TPA: 2-oxo acid dehydrogenase subunit E2 [Bacilli bacterium]|nr:2-oxo acid dehydrogenase subunit E2 [Bacilli bacterium]